VGKHLLSVLKVDTGFIALYDEQTRLIRFPFCWHEGQPVVTDVRPLGDGLTSKVIEDRRPLLLQQLTPETMLELGGIQLSQGDLQKSWLGVPIMVDDQVVGVLSGQAYPANYFDDGSVRFLSTIAASISVTLQKSQLFEQTRTARAASESRLLESEVLQQFSRTVSSTLDIDHVLDALVETLQHRLNLPYIAISLIDHEAQLLTAVRGIGDASILQGLVRRLDTLQNDITMDIVHKGQIEVIDGWDDRFDRDIYERGGHAELVRAFVPVRLRDKTVGLFEAGYRRGTRAYISPEEVRMLGGLADQLAIAIDNARLLNQVQAALAETGKLYEASRQLAAAADIPGMLAAFAETVPVADINRIVLWLFDYDAADQLAAATVAGAWYSGAGAPPPPVGVRFMPQMLRALKFIQSPEPLFLNDVDADPRTEPEMVAALRQLKVQAVAVLPLWTGGRQLGLLMLQSEHSHVFTDGETRLYVSLTQQMAVAIENRRLFEQTQRDAEREHTLNRIASRLRNAQNVEQVLNIATQELRLATMASRSIAEIAPTSTGQPPNGNGS
jgi:GAF domain-containing protein